MYLIPANTKRGQLILGLFRPFDLILFVSGVLVTVILLAIMPLSSTIETIFVLAPGGICAVLVTPIPNYHNVLNIIIELYTYLTSVQKYKWRGWCYENGKDNKE